MDNKHKRIESKKTKIGSRHRRKLKKFSKKFNTMFRFFLELNRKELITFCGSKIEIKHDVNGLCCREVFRLYEDGHYKGGKDIITRHPNVLKSVFIGKKGWGLWVDQYSDGICEWSFTKKEILTEFEKVNLEIPDSFLKEFNNIIEKKKKERNLKYYEEKGNFTKR